MKHKSRMKIKGKARQYWILCGIALIFLVPIMSALGAYFWGGLSRNTSNHGHIIQPPRDFEQLHLLNNEGKAFDHRKVLGKWTLMFVSTKTCDEICLKNLYAMQQIRLALNEKARRVARLWVVSHDNSAASMLNLIGHEYPGTLTAMMKQAYPSRLYIVDPQGNIMMEYGVKANPSGILHDMQHLLKASFIG